jgi:SAM-dependent methyltransferase
MKLYDELADWWPIFSPPSDYAEEAESIHQLIASANIPARTLLELGSGGGNNALFLKRSHDMTLTDLSEGMLACSRRLNPGCEHVRGDMRTLRLNRTFDAVLVHDAIMYMTTEADLRAAIDTAAVHCRAGGVALFMPDCVRESFAERVEHEGGDAGDRSIRWLEWAHDPDPADNTYQVDYALMLRAGSGPTRFLHDTHVEGLFARADWQRLLGEAGFEPQVIRDEFGRDVFLCVRRGHSSG